MFPNFTRAIAAVSLFASFATLAHGDYLGVGGEIPAISPLYATANAPAKQSELLDILNSNGSQGFQYRGLTFLESDESPNTDTNYFINDEADSATYEYIARDIAESSANFIGLLNELGAEGFSFVISYNPFGGPSFYIFEKQVGSTETFSYRIRESLSTSLETLSLLQSQGAEGWEWLGLRSISKPGGGTSPYQLFLKRSSRSDTETFSYRGLVRKKNAAAALSQLNTQGSEGFRYIVNLRNRTDSEILNIFVRSSMNLSNYSYSAEPLVPTRMEFVAQADAQGGSGRYFKDSQISASDPLAFGNVYVRATISAGGIDIATDGQITFTPLESGSFQLQTSTGLQSWTNSGAAQMGTAGAAITFNPGVSGTRRFFRVISQ